MCKNRHQARVRERAQERVSVTLDFSSDFLDINVSIHIQTLKLVNLWTV